MQGLSAAQVTSNDGPEVGIGIRTWVVCKKQYFASLFIRLISNLIVDSETA